jgi:excinuclease ABC subunit C
VSSQLLEISGVGPSRRRALLQAFGSVQGVRDASMDAIAAVPGFSHALAARVLTGLGVELPQPSVPDSPPEPSVE